MVLPSIGSKLNYAVCPTGSFIVRSYLGLPAGLTWRTLFLYLRPRETKAKVNGRVFHGFGSLLVLGCLFH